MQVLVFIDHKLLVSEWIGNVANWSWSLVVRWNLTGQSRSQTLCVIIKRACLRVLEFSGDWENRYWTKISLQNRGVELNLDFV